jgi:hypothetical protein
LVEGLFIAVSAIRPPSGKADIPADKPKIARLTSLGHRPQGQAPRTINGNSTTNYEH